MFINNIIGLIKKAWKAIAVKSDNQAANCLHENNEVRQCIECGSNICNKCAHGTSADICLWCATGGNW